MNAPTGADYESEEAHNLVPDNRVLIVRRLPRLGTAPVDAAAPTQWNHFYSRTLFVDSGVTSRSILGFGGSEVEVRRGTNLTIR